MVPIAAAKSSQLLCLAGCGHRRKTRSTAHGYQLRQPKIQNLGVPALGHKYVGGFNVPMNDSFAVGRLECVRDLNPQLQHLLEG